jgi:hypothetical protein
LAVGDAQSGAAGPVDQGTGDEDARDAVSVEQAGEPGGAGESAGGEVSDEDSVKPARPVSLPPPPPAAFVASDLTERWPGPPLLTVPDGADAAEELAPHDPAPRVGKPAKPKPAPILDEPPDPADEWISLLTTDPAEE